jgi:hypothetical protein
MRARLLSAKSQLKSLGAVGSNPAPLPLESIMREKIKELEDERIKILEAAIRQHRDERGDDRCHADDGRLYAVLPEGDTRPARETAVTIENCAKYIECRQTGREYISPQRRIEELELELRKCPYDHSYQPVGGRPLNICGVAEEPARQNQRDGKVPPS